LSDEASKIIGELLSTRQAVPTSGLHIEEAAVAREPARSRRILERAVYVESRNRE
jgi:hypothetical protein